MRIAIIGAGIAGLSAGWLLSPAHDVVIFDQEHAAGGHARTLTMSGQPPIDMGVQAFHPRGYPNLMAFLSYLQIPTVPSDVSFSVSAGRGKLEYTIDNLYVHKKNHLNRDFILMVREMKRFHHEAPQWLERKEPNMSLGMYLKNNKYSEGFIRDYILPVTASMWNVGVTEIRKMPARHVFRTMKLHGFLIPKDQQEWLSVDQGTQTYMAKLAEILKNNIYTDTAILSIYRRKTGIETSDKRGNIGHFDKIIFACGADQARRLLQDATDQEKSMLESVPYILSKAYLHQDKSFMPQDMSAWRGGNYLHSTRDGKICVTYHLNRLQPWLGQDKKNNYFLTLNPPREPKHILKEITYSHPVYSGETLKGWKTLKSIQGKLNTFYCGGWTGMGFHEDALVSGLTVAELIGPHTRPWSAPDVSLAANNCTPEVTA